MSTGEWTVLVPRGWQQHSDPPAELVAMAPPGPSGFAPNLNVVVTSPAPVRDYLRECEEELSALQGALLIDARESTTEKGVFDLTFAHEPEGWRVTSLQRHVVTDQGSIIATGSCATAELPIWFETLRTSVRSLQVQP